MPDQALPAVGQDPLVDQMGGVHLRIAGGQALLVRPVRLIGSRGPERLPQMEGGRTGGTESQLQPVGGDGEDVGGGEEPRVLGWRTPR